MLDSDRTDLPGGTFLWRALYEGFTSGPILVRFPPSRDGADTVQTGRLQNHPIRLRLMESAMSDGNPWRGNWVARLYERVRERGYDSGFGEFAASAGLLGFAG